MRACALTSTAFGATLRVPRPSSTTFYTWAPHKTGGSGGVRALGLGPGAGGRGRDEDGRTDGRKEAEEMMLGLRATPRCSNYGHRFDAMRGHRSKLIHVVGAGVG